ncbi:hypothetical protein [Nocardia sp. NPDC049526]|uniref:EamA family transporter n=1 Tax=Nocardia sp. NPDC049526 TaxID=3364316 RepID=UPI0037B76EFF
MNTAYRSLALLVVATSLWGASSALIARTAATGFAAGAPVAAGGAVSLLLCAVAAGDNPVRAFRAGPGLFLRLGALEVVNLAFYAAALRIGPLPVVVALHLTAPVLIIATHIVRGMRELNLVVIVELVLVGAAICLVAGRPPAGTPAWQVLLACALAVASAASVALLIGLVARESADRATLSAAGLQLLCAGVLGAPLLVLRPPSVVAATELAVIGAALLGPGFACYWWALRRLDATTAGIVGLNEAVVASIIGTAVAGSHVTAATLLAGALVLMAVGLEVRTTRASGAPPPRTPRMPRVVYPRWLFRLRY